MSNTTAEKVRAIIEVDPSITDLTPFLAAAHALVESHCEGISTANAAIVETWLAAHCLTIRDPRVINETAKGVGQSYQSRVDLGLSVSHYGQTAMMLDETGGLAAWNKQVLDGKTNPTTMLTWLGKT